MKEKRSEGGPLPAIFPPFHLPERLVIYMFRFRIHEAKFFTVINKARAQKKRFINLRSGYPTHNPTHIFSGWISETKFTVQYAKAGPKTRIGVFGLFSAFTHSGKYQNGNICPEAGKIKQVKCWISAL